MEINPQDQKKLESKWHYKTNSLNQNIDDAFLECQNEAYEIGYQHGLQDAKEQSK